MRPRRLLIAAYFDPALPGGGTQYSVDMAREWIRRGFDVHVICSDHSRTVGDLSAEVSAGHLTFHPLVDADRLLLAHRFDPSLYRTVSSLITKVDPETIHIHNFHGLLAAVEAAVDSGRPTIYTALDFGMVCPSWYLYDGALAPCSGPEADKCRRCLHRLHPVTFRQRLLSRLPAPLLRLLGLNADYLRQFALLPAYYDQIGTSLEHMLPLLKRFDVVLLISPALKSMLVRYGVDPTRIHLGVQGAEFEPPAASQTSGGVRLIFLGHVAPIKGFHVVAEAATLLPDALPLEIRIYGKDARRYADQLPASARRYVHAFDTLVGADVERELAQADALVIPSLWAENTPYAVLRALAAGRPVIAANQEGVTHLIEDGKNGWLLPAGDVSAWRAAIEKAARDPQSLRRLRPACSFRKSVRDYAGEIEEAIQVRMRGVRV